MAQVGPDSREQALCGNLRARSLEREKKSKRPGSHGREGHGQKKTSLDIPTSYMLRQWFSSYDMWVQVRHIQLALISCL